MDFAAFRNLGDDGQRKLAMTVTRGAIWAFAFAALATCARAPRHEPHLLPVVESPIPLPPGFGLPPTPQDNPLTLAKAELGRYLFYDRRLSHNQTQSCASCHQQRLGFCDGRAHAIGSTGEEHRRNTMSLANVGYRHPLTWADPNVQTLEQQVHVPLTNRDPVEMGMADNFDELVARLRADPRYVRMFRDAFPDQRDPITIDNVARALASFERTLISAGSPYDRLVLYGDSNALSESAWRGRRLFFSKRLACASCHGGPDFARPPEGSVFQNTGIYDSADKFRVVSLRNVAVTAPYMHDGSAATLADVIDDYAAGGRAARLQHRKPSAGVAVRPFSITATEKRDLIAFLESLTDEDFLTNPHFSDPW
jgi:cytochrome c peroxidase